MRVRWVWEEGRLSCVSKSGRWWERGWAGPWGVALGWWTTWTLSSKTLSLDNASL